MMLLVLLFMLSTGWHDRHGEQLPLPVAEVSVPEVLPQHHHHHEATLTDATNLYRVCTSRPQRVLPTHGSNSERTVSPCHLSRRRIVEPLKFRHDGRRRLESAPFCRSASCDYYVYALRHIIR